MPGKVGPAKPDRYMQPSILMALIGGESYGYELSQRIGDYGFLRGEAPPGMIYRHLRQMEDEHLVTSRWEAHGAGPARRVYALTSEGREVLDAWISYMKRQAGILTRFVDRYTEATKAPDGEPPAAAPDEPSTDES